MVFDHVIIMLRLTNIVIKSPDRAPEELIVKEIPSVKSLPPVLSAISSPFSLASSNLFHSLIFKSSKDGLQSFHLSAKPWETAKIDARPKTGRSEADS
uniref:Uncharacterized protein n=1 Tax=Utricularia reniformis TaxID=192314 RepID=A0A1Y0B3A9_9LAMI|nr:hypothetical protein AEK19_MT1759 [Utricularia reniformis]ART31935.1 hypothetical protein AEK19_MT1759 [Utricularia reniformis]